MRNEALDVPPVMPATTAEARDLIARAGLAAPRDLDLYKTDQDLAAIMNERGIDPTNHIDRLILRSLGFGEDFSYLTPRRTSVPTPRSYDTGRMDPEIRLEAALQTPHTYTRPYNT